MNVKCKNTAVAQKAKLVLVRAGVRYTERGPYIGSKQVDLVVHGELGEDTLTELRALAGVTITE